MICVYAITDQAPAGLPVAGLEGAPLELVEHRGLRALVSEHADDFEAAPDPTALWAHEAAVEAFGGAAVLPLRFGTTLPGRSALIELLARDEQRFRRLLGRVRGQVELAVRVGLPEKAPVPEPQPATGAAHIEALIEADRERAEVAERVLRPLGAVATASARRHSDGRVLAASFLLPPRQVDTFTAVVRELQANHPELAVSCTGPWAPYSFVEEAQDGR